MITAFHDDARRALRRLPTNSIHACVTDPPYGLGTPPDPEKMLRAWLDDGHFEAGGGGFMGRAWDSFVPGPALWREVYRVLRPGAHLVAFFGSRTVDVGALAIRLAGFEIRDSLAWIHGQGFPKGQDISKGVDHSLGAIRTKIRHAARPISSGTFSGKSDTRPWIERSRVLGYHEVDSNDPVTEEAAQWSGWSSQLKPAVEPIVLARKPLVGSLVENTRRWGCGGLHVDGCRIGNEKLQERKSWQAKIGAFKRGVVFTPSRTGRYPANVIHDGSPEVLAGFPGGAGARAPVRGDEPSAPLGGVVYGHGLGRQPSDVIDDLGSAARFFYCAKASGEDRKWSRHPTVKPVALMEWLVRLVVPAGGVLVDPFAGSGTTGEAARRNGVDAILVEREAEYAADIRRRFSLHPVPGKFGLISGAWILP